MKIVVRCLAVLMALLALTAAGLGVYTVLQARGKPPVLVQVSPVAQQRVTELFSALEKGDYSAAEAVIFGQPSLGMDRPVKEALAASVWDAYQSTLKFEPISDFYPTDTGLAIAYRVTRLDIDSVMAPVAERAEALMEQRILEAERVEEIYDSNNEYRDDFVQETMRMAVEAALQEDPEYTQTEFVVELIYQEGTWWILGDGSLMDAITADFGG